MHAFVAFLSLISPAFADEPVSSTAEARAVYVTSLRSQLDASNKSKEEAAAKCEAAKTQYRAAQAELAPIDAELAVPVNPALGQMQTENRARYTALRRTQEALLTDAKSDAKTAGGLLTAAQTKIEVLQTEIDRVIAVDQAQREGAMRTSTEVVARGGFTSYTSPDPGLGFRRVQPPKPAPLPTEFSTCFPNEVEAPS